MSHRSPFSHRLKARFVLWCEIAGYAICAVVAAFCVYAFTVKRDITVTLSGELAPRVEVVAAPADLLFTSVEVEAASLVDQGQALARFATGDTDRRRARARVALSQAREALSLLEAAEAEQARALVAEALQIVPEESQDEALASPSAGLLYPALPWKPGDEQPADAELFTVYGIDELVLVASAPLQGDARRLEAGQEATATLGDPPVELRGTVSSVETRETDLQVTLSFKPVDAAAVAEAYRAHFADAAPGAFPPVQARVLVGQRNLFLELFGRR